MLAPKDPQSILGLAWQVHAGITAIAFAGLALFFQFSTQSLIAGHTIRGALFSMTYFLPILVYCLAADIELALVTAWFSTPAALVIQMFFVFLGSVFLIAFAYWRVLRVFVQPGVIEGVGQVALLELLRQSADSNKAIIKANARLAGIVPVSWSSPDSSGTDVQRLVRSSRRRVLTDVNLPRIRDVVMELEAKSGASQGRLDENRRSELHMLAELGSSVGENKYVFYVANADLFTDDWEKLERRILNALDWDSQQTSELRRFEAEINVLRDNIHEAISSGASGRTRQGLEIVQAAMHRAVQIREEASRSAVQPLSDLVTNVSYGQEWDILIRAMFDLISASSDTLSARTKMDIHDLLFRLLQDFCGIEELPAVQSCLNLVIADWSASLASLGVNGSQDQGYILLRLSEVAEFALPSSGRPPFQESAMGLLADTFIKCAKAAVDRGDAGAATRAITFLRQTFEFESGDDTGVAFQRSRELGLLVLLAWILFRKDNQFSDSEIDRTATEIESAIPQSNMWELTRRAKESEDQSTLRWSWWESTISLSRRWFGFATMPTYVNLAALKLASTRTFEPPSPPAENDISLARNLDELLGAIRRGDFRNLENELASVNLENAELIVMTVLDEVVQRRRDILAQTPLDNARIERFRTALQELLVDGSRPRLAKIIGDEVTSGTARRIGFRQPVNKWWFVESDVIAEPEMLARRLARALMSEEEEAIISTILKATPPVEVRTDSINDNLPDWLTSMKNDGVIVANSWDAYYSLIPDEQFERLAEDELLKTASGIPVLRLYDDRSPFVAAFLTPRGIRCKLSSPTDEVSTPSAFVIDNTILVSVRELTESNLMAFATDSETSQNEYRARALIEATEELTVEVNDSSYVRVWTLITEDQ